MQTTAIVFDKPERLDLRSLQLADAGEGDVVVETIWSGVSAGTEKLLYKGSMPAFPGMGYPLVPGYEAVGRVVETHGDVSVAPGDLVFVPGARCYTEAAGLFGASASKLVVPASRVTPIAEDLGETGTLLSLAATAHHALAIGGGAPDLIIGHGILGRLIARIAIALGHPAPIVEERNPARANGAAGYTVAEAGEGGSGLSTIIDASGDPAIIDAACPRLTRGGSLVMAGFYSKRLSFQFAPAFMREMQLRIAAEFTPADTNAVLELLSSGLLSFDGLISHASDLADVETAYRTAFFDPLCVKMVVDWRTLQ